MKYLSEYHKNQLKTIDIDIFEKVEKEGDEINIFTDFIKGQTQSLRRVSLGIDPKYNERFTN
jgi:hypothetical protein